MRNRVLILLILLVLVLASPLWWPLAADFLRPRVDFAETPVSRNEQKQFALEGVFFTQSRAGRQEWEITASQLTTIAERQNELHLEGVEALLGGAGESQLFVSSDQGIYNTNTLMLTLTDDVLVDMSDGHELRTDLLRYLERERRVETEAPVRLDGPDLEVKGQGLVYDLTTGSYSVGGPVSVVIK
jgi:LPS export ABC transporter protein LptC